MFLDKAADADRFTAGLRKPFVFVVVFVSAGAQPGGGSTPKGLDAAFCAVG